MPNARAPSVDVIGGDVNRTLLSMATPISIGMLSTFLFQVIDTYFVGQLGPGQLAALSFASTLYFLLVAVFIGLAVGVSAIVAKTVGAGDDAEVRRLATLALLLAAALSSALALAGYRAIDATFALLGADAATLVFIRQYMEILYAGLPLLLVGIVGSSVVRATGDVKPPEIAMGIAGLINLVFDYLLIFGVGPFPRLELRGAAYATVLSWAFVFAATAHMVLRRRLCAPGSIRPLAMALRAYRSLFRLALPSVATQLLTPLTAAFLTALLAQFGADTVAAYGVASRIEQLALIGILGVSSAVTPFVAQNFGAAEKLRVDDAIVFAGKASVAWGLLLFAGLIAGAGPVAGIFSADPAVVATTASYFHIVAVSYIFYGLLSVTSAIFNGVQIPGESLKILLVKTFVLTLPLAYAGSHFGVAGIFAAIALSNIAGGLYAGRVMRRSLVRSGSTLAGRSALADYAADIRGLRRRN